MAPSEHELRLRERLSRLRNMPLLGEQSFPASSSGSSASSTGSAPTRPTRTSGARFSSRATRTARTRSTTSSGSSTTGSSSTATAGSATTARWSPASGSSAADGRARRPAEGPGHPGADAAPVRDAVSRGLPQGDPGDAAGRPPRLPAGLARRHAPVRTRALPPSSMARAARSPIRRPRWRGSPCRRSPA
jgi:hypothetical protein